MNSVGIITFLHNNNFGSTLQAYALQKTVTGLGYDCVHLDYRPDSKEKILNLLRSGNDLKLVMEGLRKRSVQAAQSGARSKAETFTVFYRQRMRLTAVCRNRSELKKESGGKDILLCGSDQIWSPVWLNPVYFLNFAGKEQKRIAYAASLGVRQLPEERKIRKIRALLKDFDAVSVREEEGARLLKEMTGTEAAVMPDPVCLLSRDDWEAIAETPDCNTPYILCYFIGESPEYWKRVDELQRETGMQVVILPVTAQSYEKTRYTLADGASPEAFLGYVRNAAAVCTDSFHCSLFTLIFGKMPCVFRRYREDDPESKNSRIDQLFRSLDLTPDQPADPVRLTAALETLRKTGKAWLTENLGALSGKTSGAGKAEG